MKIKEAALREIQRMEKVFSNIEIVEDTRLLNLAKSYFADAKYFYEKGDFLNAFEAIVISWAYVDALLHFGKVKVSEELKKFFTIS